MIELADVSKQRFRGETVGVVCGGGSKERSVSLRTGEAMYDALLSLDYDVRKYVFPEDIEQVIDERPEAVIIALHGRSDEGGGTQGFFETLDIPYSGSGILSSALAMDKRLSKQMFSDVGLNPPGGFSFPVAAEWTSQSIHDKIETGIGYPVVVKPNRLGSSVGVSICTDRAELERVLADWGADSREQVERLLVEEYIGGGEYTVGYFDDTCLGVMEVIPDEGFYDFESKYESPETEYEPISDETDIFDVLKERGQEAFKALECSGVARIDFRAEQSSTSVEPRVLEVNTIPGMTETSLIPKMAQSRGISFPEFVEWTLATAETDEPT